MTLPFSCFLTSHKREDKGKKLGKIVFSDMLVEGKICIRSSLGPCDRYLEMSSPQEDAGALGRGEF